MNENSLKGRITQCKNCEYKWTTQSKMEFVVCPKCLTKTKVGQIKEKEE